MEHAHECFLKCFPDVAPHPIEGSYHAKYKDNKIIISILATYALE